MSPKANSRRRFVKNVAGGFGLLSLPALLHGKQPGNFKKIKVVCIGAHPDDPESGCGGTLAKFANAGHDVTVIYLTNGDSGIKGKSLTEAAAIRKQEAVNACGVLNAKPVFAGQVNGDTVMNNEWIIKMQQLVDAEKPDIVFAHWPLDEHKDHQIAALLAVQVWMRMQRRFLLYFFEVCAGIQTMGFHPTDYIDITDTQEQKRRAVYCHVSQDPPGIYACGHASMEEFRGRELGAKAGEAFVRLTGQRQGSLLMDYQ